MTFRQFNAAFRPLVDRAWGDHCTLSGTPLNSNAAKDRWYRDQLWSCCGIRSTKEATPRQQRELLDRFSLLSQAGGRPEIDGWTTVQNMRFTELAQAAWRKVCADGYRGPFGPWLDQLLDSAGVVCRHAADRRESFDKVMAGLAVIAQDAYWIHRTAEAAEIRMRWQILRYLGDLEYLTKTPHTWDYVRGIWYQSAQVPSDIDDAPADFLRKVLAILDTHVRRLCRDYGIRPADLPSRTHPHDRPVAIREENPHLHLGHALDHCPPVRLPVAS
jgi:hypothetical protein